LTKIKNNDIYLLFLAKTFGKINMKTKNFLQLCVAGVSVHGDVPELNSKAQIPLGGGA